MATLPDFGYKQWETPAGVPLLIIAAHYPGGSMPPFLSDYEQLVFGTPDGSKKSVVGYFHEVSKGRFKWARAGAIDVNLPETVRRIGKKTQRAASIIQEASTVFDFSHFDRSKDGQVAGWELAPVIFEPGGGELGQTERTTDPPFVAGVQEPTVMMEGNAGLNSVCHELTHYLRGQDVYGEWKKKDMAALNDHLSIMSTSGGSPIFHLDPWHKMRFGWLEPRIRSLYEPATETLTPASGFRGDEAVILFDPMRGTREYFIVEYRSQLLGEYDSDASDNGLVIWHVVPDLCPFPADPLVLGSPDLTHGQSTVWKGGITPKLQWADGTDTGIIISISSFPPGAGSVTFSWDRLGQPQPAFFSWASLGGDIRQPCTIRDQNGCISLFAVGADQGLWQIRQTAASSASYSGWQSLGGNVREPCVARNQDGRLEVFAVGSDQALWNLPESTPGSFIGWNSLGGDVRQPCAILNSNGEIEVFAVGRDGALWHTRQLAPNNGFGKWRSLGGNIRQPCALHDYKGRVWVFAVGTDGGLWRITQTGEEDFLGGSFYTDWSSWGGNVSDPVAVLLEDRRIRVFAVGGKNELFTNAQTEHDTDIRVNDLTDWQKVCGTVWQPTVITNRHGCSEIYAVGANSELWWRRQLAPNGYFAAWDTLGGLISDPIAVDNMDGRIVIFVVAPNNELWHRTQTRPL
jgi:M6 family metalloprotease-like protein